MEYTRLGRTNLKVSRTSFGCIPIQRISFEEARELLRKAYESGINFYDTARGYTDSEEKIGYAFSKIREKIILATKIRAENRDELMEKLKTSLSNLKTDYVDLLQIHNPQTLPDPHEPKGIYRGLIEAKENGMAKHLGLTSHKLPLAIEGVKSQLYDTLQFPLCTLSTTEELELVHLCRDHDVGFIAMKALSGGMITNVASAFAFLRQYQNVIPIWGIEKQWQLNQFLELEKNPPPLDDDLQNIIKQDQAELTGAFCRGCEYCLPCPAEIPIPSATRVKFMLKRTALANILNQEWKEKMELINDCQECGHCQDNCPYELDVPALLRENLQAFRQAYRDYR